MPPSTPWLFRPRPVAGASVQILCFAYAGGGAGAVFRGWQEALPPAMQVCAVQPPGRENRLAEPAFTAMGPLVAAAAEALTPSLRPPFALFGHSLGALIAFELARQLRRDGAPGPIYLFVSACAAPQLPQFDKPLHALPRAEFMEELRRLKGTPEGVLRNNELFDLFLPTLRADFAVLETYRYSAEGPLDCPVTAFGGEEDDQTRPDELAGWARQTTGAFQVRLFPGGHFFLKTALPSLLRAVAADLEPYRSQGAS